MSSVRRVVTGLDSDGRSTVLIDDRVELGGTRLLWASDATPADNEGVADTGARDFTFDRFRSPGSTFLVTEMQPGDTASGPFMHATDTLDYLVVIKGEVELHLETGAVRLGPGDCIVDRGVVHGWQVVGDQSLVMATAFVPSIPVGKGGTI